MFRLLNIVKKQTFNNITYFGSIVRGLMHSTFKTILCIKSMRYTTHMYDDSYTIHYYCNKLLSPYKKILFNSLTWPKINGNIFK